MIISHWNRTRPQILSRGETLAVRFSLEAGRRYSLTTSVAFAIAASVAFSVVIWEYVTLLPDEIRLYRRPVWGTVPPYGFLALRYGGILATLPLLFLSAIKTAHCQIAASLSQAGVILVITSSALLFTFRTSLLWPGNRMVRYALAALLVIMTACWISLATQFRAVSGLTPPFGSNCRVLPTVFWLPLSNASSALFFITTLVLTLHKIRHSENSFAERQIYRANLLYLIGTVVTVAIALILQPLAVPKARMENFHFERFLIVFKEFAVSRRALHLGRYKVDSFHLLIHAQLVIEPDRGNCIYFTHLRCDRPAGLKVS
ncbi:hypothetical protein C8R47DRAFT_993157 [Mycena vitilis]|nr:hypothetical protein C8R47DRAFT_993157 [Mycena vitilis]